MPRERGDVMDGIEHWTLVICANCRQRRTFGLDSPKCACCGMCEWREVEVVPRDVYEGTVETVTDAIVILGGLDQPWDALDYPERCARVENELRGLLGRLGGDNDAR